MIPKTRGRRCTRAIGTGTLWAILLLPLSCGSPDEPYSTPHARVTVSPPSVVAAVGKSFEVELSVDTDFDKSTEAQVEAYLEGPTAADYWVVKEGCLNAFPTDVSTVVWEVPVGGPVDRIAFGLRCTGPGKALLAFEVRSPTKDFAVEVVSADVDCVQP